MCPPQLNRVTSGHCHPSTVTACQFHHSSSNGMPCSLLLCKRLSVCCTYSRKRTCTLFVGNALAVDRQLFSLGVCADSEKSRTEWVNAIQQVIVQEMLASQSVAPSPTHAGHHRRRTTLGMGHSRSASEYSRTMEDVLTEVRSRQSTVPSKNACLCLCLCLWLLRVVPC